MMRTRSKSAGSPRRGVILLIVLAMLTLFAIVGLAFILYAGAEAQSARLFREAESLHLPDGDPELLFSYFMGQFLYDVPDDETGVYSALRGHSLARNMFGWNYAVAANGTPVPDRNEVPFNGLGRQHTAAPGLLGVPSPGTYNNPYGRDDYYLVNYQHFRGDSFLRDPERFGAFKTLPNGSQVYRPWRTDPRDPTEVPGLYNGGFNPSYTYPDPNHLFLAAVKADGTVLTPSFHRPWFEPEFPSGANKYFGTLDPSNPNWYDTTKPWLKYLVLRPRPADMGPGFPRTEDAGGDVKNLKGGPGYFDPVTGRYHNNDSIWIDLDFPVMRAPDGRKYKPLFAPLIMDLDNRVNLNVHGNLRGVVVNPRTGQPILDPQTRQPIPTHVSNQGWGAWEVNPSYVLNRDATEWSNLFQGNNAGAGRYGRLLYPSSPLSPNLLPSPVLGRFYAPLDFDGARERTTYGPTAQFRMPGTRPSPAFQCFPAVPAGYGNASPAERLNHPQLYNPLQPTPPDRRFGLSNLEALLRYGDTGSAALTSDLFTLCPQNFGDRNDPAGSARRRRLVTVHSFDPDRPGVAPWFWPASPAVYSGMPARLNAPPAGGAVPVPPSLLPSLAESEFGPDMRAAASLTALRRLDLNRYLPDYPLPGANGRINDLVNFAVAQRARQYFTAEIYERLWRLTGANAPALQARPGLPGHDPQRWHTLRWLAQLAVNIVDFIDSDNYITPFQWYPGDLVNPLGEWVYGTELPRVVLNEAYVEYANDPTDPGLRRQQPVATRLKGNVWVELYNAMQDDPPLSAPHRSGTTQLEIPESAAGAGDNYGVYQLLVGRMNGNLNQPDNVRGDPLLAGAGIWTALSNFSPAPGTTALVDTRVIQPADLVNNASGYYGKPGENQGFYVVGPLLDPTREQDPFPALAGGQPQATLRRPEMSYLIDALDPTLGSLPRPSLFLQRLACPHLPPNPAPGQVLDPNLPYNPYITVDYIQVLLTNYAAAVGVNGPNVPAPTAVPNRFSMGRKQPYAAHITQIREQQPTPAQAMQPKHTFFQHNADFSTPGPNWRTPPPANTNPPLVPFDWLVHLDRQLASPLELLHVSAFKPHELTQQFILGDQLNQRFAHRAPWFDEDLTTASTPQSHRLYRVFEFFGTRNQTIGMMTAGTRSRTPVLIPGLNRRVFPVAVSGVTASGGTWSIEVGQTLVIDQGLPTEEVVYVKALLGPATNPSFLADFLKPHNINFTIRPTILSERIPGRININTIWDEETFFALCDPQPANSFNTGSGSGGIVRNVFNQMKLSRTASGEIPGPGDRPFRGLATGLTPAGNPRFPAGSGIQDTLFRLAPSGGYPLFSVPVLQHPYQNYELMTKIFNNVTTRSNVFAVWITVGFFEVTDDTTRPVRLGAEVGRAENRHVRHRMFAIVDRSVLTSNPGPQRRFNPRTPSPGAPAGLAVPYFSIID